MNPTVLLNLDWIGLKAKKQKEKKKKENKANKAKNGSICIMHTIYNCK
jgi:hypothetical protein